MITWTAVLFCRRNLYRSLAVTTYSKARNKEDFVKLIRHVNVLYSVHGFLNLYIDYIYMHLSAHINVIL